MKRAFVSRKTLEFNPEDDMPKQSVTRDELAMLINEEIQRHLGDAEGCSVSARQIAYHTEDTNGSNWHLSGWFRSSRPSGDACEAIVKAATERLQKLYNLGSEAQ